MPEEYTEIDSKMKHLIAAGHIKGISEELLTWADPEVATSGSAHVSNSSEIPLMCPAAIKCFILESISVYSSGIACFVIGPAALE